MNTMFLLMAEHGSAEIPLEKVAPLFGLSRAEACKRACRQALPVPAYQPGSQKAPWMVDVRDLAAYIDAQRDKARKDWERVQGRREAMAEQGRAA